MRIFNALTLVMSLTLFSYCGKDKDEAKLNVGSNALTLWPGHDSTLTISGGAAPYTFTSSVPGIADVNIQGNKVSITAQVAGGTTITVTDANKRTGQIRFVSQTLSGSWRSGYSGNDFKSAIIVEGTDAAFATQLQTQLNSEMGFGYLMYFTTTTSIATEERFTGNSTAVKKEGTYTFANYVLTLTLAGTTEVYTVSPINSMRVTMTQDLTAKYQALNPGKGITRVTKALAMAQVLMPG